MLFQSKTALVRLCGAAIGEGELTGRSLSETRLDFEVRPSKTITVIEFTNISDQPFMVWIGELGSKFVMPGAHFRVFSFFPDDEDVMITWSSARPNEKRRTARIRFKV